VLVLTLGGSPDQAGLRFRLLGFPVTIAPAFFLVAGLIGFTGQLDVGLLAVWIGVIGVSILVHELGHAVAARGIGARPAIVIHGFGGYTTYTPPRPLSRWEQVRISLAGPFAGALLGAVVWAVWTVGAPDARDLARAVFVFGVWANLGWGLVNLLPVLPLDGGMVMEAVLPGDEERRRRIALATSIPVSGLLAVGLGWLGLPFAAVLFAFFAYSSWQELRQRRRFAPGEADRLGDLLRSAHAGDLAALGELEGLIPTLPAGEVQDVCTATLVEATARAGGPDRARRQLASLPGRVDRSIYALVDAFDGAADQASVVLGELVADDPEGPAARYLLLAEVMAGRGAEVPERYLELPRAAQRQPVLRDAQHLAFLRGDQVASARIGRFLVESLGSRTPADAYNVACSFARLGEREQAKAWLDRAMGLGWTDLGAIRRDPDLAAVRDL
jgi:Zn-dependent protease